MTEPVAREFTRTHDSFPLMAAGSARSSRPRNRHVSWAVFVLLFNPLTMPAVRRTLESPFAPIGGDRRRASVCVWVWIVGFMALVLLAARLVDRHRGSTTEYSSADVPKPRLNAMDSLKYHGER